MNPAQPKPPAENYEQYFVPAMFLPWSSVLLRHAALQAGERVLDLACGTGIVARQAAPLLGLTGQITALDINPAMLAVARSLPASPGAAIDWQQGNAMNLPFPDGAFDVVLCQHGLPFFPDYAVAVREMRRILVPGGRALVIVLQALERHPVFEALMKSVARQLVQPLASVMTPFVLSGADELRSLFAEAGFREVSIIPESIVVSFPEPERFVPLAVTSSAAAVPAFTQLETPERAALLNAVREEVGTTLRQYIKVDHLTFPMFAHVAVAST